jgi:hypothetical protein
MPLLRPAAGLPQPGRERRETERALAYWRACAEAFGGRPPTPTALDIERIATAGSEYRFAIARDAVPEDSALVIYGSGFARLLELPEQADQCVPLFRQLPERLLAMFAAGCREVGLSGAPVRREGSFARDGERRELYRAAFMPVGVNLIYGAFNSRIVDAESAPHGILRPVLRSLAGVMHLTRGP